MGARGVGCGAVGWSCLQLDMQMLGREVLESGEAIENVRVGKEYMAMKSLLGL